MDSQLNEPGTAVYPNARAAWWACIVLTLSCVLAFMDRNIVSLLVGPIQRDLGLSDTQISLLIGFAFGVFNALFGLPIGRWVDAGKRRSIASFGVACWSIATMACGLASSFPQIFLGRVAVGAGEATILPSGVSLIADYFPPARRGIPMGVLYSGVFVGGGVALLAGGGLWRFLGDRVLTVPLLGSLHSWQVVLLILGAVGLILAPCMMTVREPPRLDGATQTRKAGVPIIVVARYYALHWRTLLGHNLGFTLQNFALHAGMAWLPTLLVRTEHWSIPRAGATYGMMMLVLGPLGSMCAGLLADAFAQRGRTDGKLLVGMIAAFAGCITCVIIATNPSTASILVAIGCFSFFATFSLPLAPGALQEIMPNAMRGQATAIFLAVTNIVGGGFAATAVALLTDYVFHDKVKLHVSFGIVGIIAGVAALIVLGASLAAFRRTVANVNAKPDPARADVLRTSQVTLVQNTVA